MANLKDINPSGRYATVTIAGIDAPIRVRSQADYKCDGTADNIELALAIAALTSGRTCKETVKVFGTLVISSIVYIPSYTLIDLSEGKLYLQNNSNCNILQNNDFTNGNTEIEISGGIIDGNSSNNTAGTGNAMRIYNCTKLSISNLLIKNISQLGMYIQSCSDINISNCRLYDIGLTSVAGSIGWGCSLHTCTNAIVSNCYAYRTKRVAFSAGTVSTDIIFDNCIAEECGQMDQGNTAGFAAGGIKEVLDNTNVENEAVRITFSNCTSKNGIGLTAYEISNGANFCLVENCVAYGQTSSLYSGEGFVCTSPIEATGSNNTFSNCLAYNNQGEGFSVRGYVSNINLIGCRSINNSFITPGSYAGFIFGDNSVLLDGVYAKDCEALDDQTTKTHSYGIILQLTQNITFSGRISGFTIAPVSLTTSTLNINLDNIMGYISPAKHRQIISQILDITDGAEICIPFTDTTGTSVTDFSGNAHTGTANVTLASWTTPPSTENTLPIFNFGTGNWVNLGDNAAYTIDDNPFTIVMMVKSTSFASMVLAAKWDGTGTKREYIAYTDATSKLAFLIYDETVDAYIGQLTSAALSTSTWYAPLFIQYDGSAASAGVIFYNGITAIASGATTSGIYITTSDQAVVLAVGTAASPPGGTNVLTGQVGLFMLIKANITAAQRNAITQICNSLIGA